MKNSEYPKTPYAATLEAACLRQGEVLGFFFRGTNWEMAEPEHFDPSGSKQSLTFPQNDSNRIKGQGLEILLVSAD